jgi:hypothetical protein
MDDRLAALQAAVTELQELSVRFDKLEKTSKQSADTIKRIVTTLYNVGIDIYGEGDAAAGGINELRRKMEEYTALFEDVQGWCWMLCLLCLGCVKRGPVALTT